ncbi:hypothetical protein FGO68_gene5135 [Halteria grandinella]|uniref:Uncharacterized protein n=1 Tax=Halteria grandinella TaxID=5974 RepID=A0A8J8P568_HALGN|nr:hypothetical protein FGO68_gene5135 [Halteria grandinella]
MTLGYSPTKQAPRVYVLGKSITFRKVIKKNETNQQGTLTSNTSQTSSQYGKDCPMRALKTFVETCVSPLVKKYQDESTQECSSLMLKEEYQDNKMRAYQSQSIYGGDSEIDFSQKSRYSQITAAKLLNEKSRYKGLNLNSTLMRIEKKKWISTNFKTYGRDIFNWQGTKSLIGITEEQCWLFISSGDYEKAQFKYILLTSTLNGKPSEIKTPQSKAKSSLVKTHQKAKASESTKTTRLKLNGATRKRTNRVLKDEEDYLYSDEDLKHAKGKNSRQKTTSITDVFKSHKPQQFIPNDETFGLEDVSDDDSLFNRKSIKPTSGKNSSKKRQEKQQAKEVRVSDVWESGINFQLENELKEAVFGINPAKISRASENSKEAVASANLEQEVKKPKTQGRKQKMNYEMASGISIVHKTKAKQQRATYQEEQIQRSLSIFTTASIKHNQSDQEEKKGESLNSSKQQLEGKKQSPEPKQPKKVGRPKSSPIVKKQQEEQKVQSGKNSASKQAPNGKSLLSSKFNPATIKPLPTSQLPTKQISIESQEDNLSPEQRSNPQGGGSRTLMKILCKKNIDKQELDLEVSDHQSRSHDSQQNSDEQESDYANNEYEEDSEGETQKRHSESDHWGSHIRSMKDEDLIAKMNYSSRGGESSFDIKKGDFMRLLPSVYLNDVLINFYLKQVSTTGLTHYALQIPRVLCISGRNEK